METIEIKNIEGKILYSYTCENNTISKTLEQANLESICLNEANLSNKVIENVKLSKLRLIGANFTNSVFNNVTISDSQLSLTDLSHSEIKNTHFIDTALYNSNFVGSSINNSQFLRCTLENTLFCMASIEDSEFLSKRMRNINFNGTLFNNVVYYGGGVIKNTHDVSCIGNIGSRGFYTTVFNTDKGIFVSCGCFFGTLKEFKKQVLITHKNIPQYKKEYLDMIDYVQKRFKPKFSLKSIFKRSK